MMTNAQHSTHVGGGDALARLGALLRPALETVLLWHQRARQRRQLVALEDRLYRDIGVSPLDAYREAQKPFLRA